ncbi:hypothetical protein AMJ71_02785 [candidate division TA06 bacterium SM1_40]|uniref:CARDB domain-containing protein n=1 Tax=candidate division TA06 bacterium SM1_40 TaxID=1703773 RepID=A0A0S8JLD8_UNCT6|nr:MAG: hypothetical protein AMJ71_02785 [candidate division TA06 bacterium SM1_40]
MKRGWVFVVLVAMVALAVLAFRLRAEGQRTIATRSHERAPEITLPRSSGGPDDWGYIYVDSDPPDPVITYEWIDLETAGWVVDTVAGLGDDNVVGPFPIGFDFPYYWYDVDQFYVGSNGYISFSDDMLEAAPFVQYPKSNRPNDVLGVFTDDLEFGNPAAPNAICRYATNSAADTLVIDYLDVPFWAYPTPTGNNTFQIILSQPDSAIRYQYFEQTGSGSSSNTRSVGWEDIVGHWGYSYLFGLNPPQNDIHAGLAIAIYDTATYEPAFHDIGIEAVMSGNSGGFFTEFGEPLVVWTRVYNGGSRDEASFHVRMTIRDEYGSVVFQRTWIVPVLGIGEAITLVFEPWIPAMEGLYTVRVENLLIGDENPANDVVDVECHVAILPATFDYCDAILESGVPW